MMSASKTPSLPLGSDVVPKVFATLDAFNEGYAGPDTKLLEQKSRGMSGFLLSLTPKTYSRTDVH